MIDSESQLDIFANKIRGAKWLAIDTEADSLHSYPEKLCLMQIAIPDQVELVDTLCGVDLVPMWDAMGSRELIMHGADYDLRLLKSGHDFVPDRIFDTMTAARLIGREKFGLGDLVSDYVGVSLEKSSQKANWAKRPLTPKMMEYALDDARYLQPLAEKLSAELKNKGRDEWHRQECAQLIIENTNLPAPDLDQVWRIKGSNRLSPDALSVLRELWHWREGEAKRLNRPPFFILAHDRLIDLASTSAEGGDYLHMLPRRISPRRRDGIIDAIRRGCSEPSVNHPQPIKAPSRRNVTNKQKCRFSELQARRDKHAGELGIDPTLIASRATLMTLALDGNDGIANLLNWQRDLLAV